MADSDGGSFKVVALLIALVLVGTVLAWRVLPEHTRADVFVIGDSVTFLSGSTIEQELGQGHVEFVAKPSYSSTRLLPLVTKAMERKDGPAASREQVAVLVGYNDVRKREVASAKLPELVKETSEFDCGVWLTVPSRPAGRASANPAADSDQMDVWNARMEQEVGRYDNLHMATDWQDAVTDAPMGTLLEGDGVHPNERGKEVLARSYRAALDREC